MLFSKNPDDIKRFLSMNDERRKLIDETPPTPLSTEYGVNTLAKNLHPGYVKAKLISVTDAGYACKTLRFQPLGGKKFPYFRAGQYITISKTVGKSFLTRPYSISSSPKDALRGILEVTVQRAGVFSTYLTEQAKVGDVFLLGEPSGDFYCDDIRDGKNIVAVAGGSGITPFISMAKSLAEGSCDFNLLIVYGAKTRKDLIVESKDICCSKVKLVVVLSEEQAEGYEHGLISAEILNKYVPENYTLFLCGPNGMYKFLEDVVPKLVHKPRFVRKEHNCVGNLKKDSPKTFSLTVHIRDAVSVIAAKENETILTALEKAGLKVPSRCRFGACGFCHTRLICGEYFVEKENDHRRKADVKFRYIHPCCTYPLSDMELDVPPIAIEVDV